jgi:hypothetical protein
VSTELTETKPAALAMGSRGMELRTLDDVWRFATCVAKSGMAPKGIGTPEAIVVAVEMGLEIGLKPMQALQSIAVINGRPSVGGDAAKALVMASGEMELCQEVASGHDDDYGYTCTIKRVGHPPESTRFTIRDAKRAQLWGKAGPWTQYPQRMLQMRARSWRLRDSFPDVLRGVRIAEEEMDVPRDRAEPSDKRAALEGLLVSSPIPTETIIEPQHAPPAEAADNGEGEDAPLPQSEREHPEPAHSPDLFPHPTSQDVLDCVEHYKRSAGSCDSLKTANKLVAAAMQDPVVAAIPEDSRALIMQRLEGNQAKWRSMKKGGGA